MKGSTWGNWDPREVQQPFRPNPNEVGDRTTNLRRLLIGAVPFCRKTCLLYLLRHEYLNEAFSQLLNLHCAVDQSLFLPHFPYAHAGSPMCKRGCQKKKEYILNEVLEIFLKTSTILLH